MSYEDDVCQIYFIDSVTNSQSTASAPKPESYSGRVVFYTNSPENIDIYVEGNFEGTLNKYFYGNMEPSCDQTNAVVWYENTPGTYSYKAESKSGTWKGTITVEGGVCTLFRLKK